MSISDHHTTTADGTVNSARSSTFSVVGRDEFNISYVDGTGSSGDYFQDTFGIGGTTLTQLEMGLATDTTIGVGIMGIGYESDEANTGTGNGSTYPNIPVQMVNQGKANSVAYSLWLDDLQASSGSVLFGGIDTGKYTGDLISVDVYPDTSQGGVTSFTVAWTSLSVSSSSGSDQLTSSTFAEAAILDSGTTITLLPDAIAAKIFTELGAEDLTQTSIGAVVVPCALASKNGTINYGFGGSGGPTIEVQVSQLVLPLTSQSGATPTFSNGVEACQLLIEAAGDIPTLFGDSFLRSAYVVYDLANNRIALAQTDFNSTDSNIVAFPSLSAAIPSATSAPNEAAVTQAATGNPRVVNTASATGTATVTYNPTATGLNAASGFQGTVTSTSTSTKKSGAGQGPAPFEWARVLVLGVCVLGMGVGGGVYTLI